MSISMLLVLLSTTCKHYMGIQLKEWRHLNHTQFMTIYIFINEIVMFQEKLINYLFTTKPCLPFLPKIYLLNHLLWTKEEICFKGTLIKQGMWETSCEYIFGVWEYKKIRSRFWLQEADSIGKERHCVSLITAMFEKEV